MSETKREITADEGIELGKAHEEFGNYAELLTDAFVQGIVAAFIGSLMPEDQSPIIRIEQEITDERSGKTYIVGGMFGVGLKPVADEVEEQPELPLQ